LKFAKICQKQALKYAIFVNIKKRPNGQTILFLENSFKKGKIWQILPLKRPNGNPAWNLLTVHPCVRGTPVVNHILSLANYFLSYNVNPF